MLRPRLIPCLLVRQKGLVKTLRFTDEKYVGDPINAVRIFNEKEVDELMVLDIDATARQSEPDYVMITNLAAECRMPLCYGGGVKTVQQIVKIIGMGVEKVAISSVAVSNPRVVSEMASYVGSQSIVAVLDLKKNRSGIFEIWTHNGTRNTGRELVEFARELEGLGIGELVLNSIDRDGTMLGYDREILRRIRDIVRVPVTVLGGAASLDDIGELVREFGIVGAAAGSLFVFKGAFKAVLINYPSRGKKLQLLGLDGNHATGGA